MKQLIYLMIAAIFLLACENEKPITSQKTESNIKHAFIEKKLKENKFQYKIKKGEKIKIYYTANSCCPFCSPRLKELKNIQFLSKSSETTSEGCEGCTDLYALNFIGRKSGKDTVYMKSLTPRDECATYQDFTKEDMHIIVVE